MDSPDCPGNKNQTQLQYVFQLPEEFTVQLKRRKKKKEYLEKIKLDYPLWAIPKIRMERRKYIDIVDRIP